MRVKTTDAPFKRKIDAPRVFVHKFVVRSALARILGCSGGQN